jgi:hypothetical protein
LQTLGGHGRYDATPTASHHIHGCKSWYVGTNPLSFIVTIIASLSCQPFGQSILNSHSDLLSCLDNPRIACSPSFPSQAHQNGSRFRPQHLPRGQHSALVHGNFHSSQPYTPIPGRCKPARQRHPLARNNPLSYPGAVGGMVCMVVEDAVPSGVGMVGSLPSSYTRSWI